MAKTMLAVVAVLVAFPAFARSPALVHRGEVNERRGDFRERRGERQERRGEALERRGARLERRGFEGRGEQLERRGERIERRGARSERVGERQERRGERQERVGERVDLIRLTSAGRSIGTRNPSTSPGVLGRGRIGPPRRRASAALDPGASRARCVGLGAAASSRPGAAAHAQPSSASPCLALGGALGWAGSGAVRATLPPASASSGGKATAGVALVPVDARVPPRRRVRAVAALMWPRHSRLA